MLPSIPNDIKRTFIGFTSASSYYTLSRLSKQIASICHHERYSQRSLVRLSRVVTLPFEQYTVTPSGHRYGWSIACNSNDTVLVYRRLSDADYFQHIIYVDGNITYDQACFNNDWDIIHREWSLSGELSDISHWRRVTLEGGGRKLCHLSREGDVMRELQKYPEEESFRPLASLGPANTVPLASLGPANTGPLDTVKH